jgi:hypothetical protein
MRQFNLKHGWLVPDPVEAECAPGRTIYPEPMRMAEPGWARQPWQGGEMVVRPEGEIEDEEHTAAREWLWHLENGRINP